MLISLNFLTWHEASSDKNLTTSTIIGIALNRSSEKINTFSKNQTLEGSNSYSLETKQKDAVEE